jgi:hypothetical protein
MIKDGNKDNNKKTIIGNSTLQKITTMKTIIIQVNNTKQYIKTINKA